MKTLASSARTGAAARNAPAACSAPRTQSTTPTTGKINGKRAKNMENREEKVYHVWESGFDLVLIANELFLEQDVSMQGV